MMTKHTWGQADRSPVTMPGIWHVWRCAVPVADKLIFGEPRSWSRSVHAGGSCEFIEASESGHGMFGIVAFSSIEVKR